MWGHLMLFYIERLTATFFLLYLCDAYERLYANVYAREQEWAGATRL